MRAKLSLLLLLLASGCAQDPYKRPGTWSLPPAGQGANDANLRAMLVNPADQTAGTGENTSLGPMSAHPVDALITGRRQPLPSVNASTVGAGSQQQSGAPVGQPAGGGTQ